MTRYYGKIPGLSLAFAIVFALTQPHPAAAQPLYVIKSARGVVTFTNRRPSDEGSFRIFKPRGVTFSRFYTRRPFAFRAVKSQFDNLIRTLAEAQSVEAELVKAVVHAESAFNPHAVSPKGARGLMQLMPGTARRFGVKDVHRPHENVSGGVRYLRLLLDRYSGDEKLALAAYNAGEGAVDQFGSIPPYTETQDYVRRVLKLRELYRCVDAGRKNCGS